MIENDDKFTLFRTSDLYFSAYLCAMDVPMEATESEPDGNSKKVIFIFKVPRKDLERFKSGFFGGNATVKAQKYVQAIRSLKQMCYI